MVSEKRTFEGLKFKLSPFSINNGYVSKIAIIQAYRDYKHQGYFARRVKLKKGWVLYITKSDIPARLKKKGAKSIWLGDWDFDGTPNIDDKTPFNPKSNTPVNKEVSVSKAYKNMQKTRVKYRKQIKPFAKSLNATKKRVKEPYSIIAKQLGRNIKFVEDLGGVRMTFNTRKELKKHAHKLKKEYKRLGRLKSYEDKYALAWNDENKRNPYRAVHMTITKYGKPYEIQLLTKVMEKIAIKGHEAYKNQDWKQLKELRIESDEEYKKGQ